MAHEHGNILPAQPAPDGQIASFDSRVQEDAFFISGLVRGLHANLTAVEGLEDIGSSMARTRRVLMLLMSESGDAGPPTASG